MIIIYNLLNDDFVVLQESTRDSVQLLDDPNGELVKSISSKLGMSEIGWMFTDLVAEDAAKGTVRHFRHAATHFLSAQECIMAGHFQSTHPNACRNSSSGYMGSKFVTICVTGNVPQLAAPSNHASPSIITSLYH